MKCEDKQDTQNTIADSLIEINVSLDSMDESLTWIANSLVRIANHFTGNILTVEDK